MIRRERVSVSIIGLVVAALATGCSSDSDMNMDGTGGGSSTGGKSNETSCTTEMFGKYGADAFLAVRDSIVEKALAAPTDKLGDSFQNFAANSSARVPAFKDNLAAILVKVYGGPDDYHGASMQSAHKGLHITSDQYDYFITEVVVPALSDNGVPESDITECFAPPVTDAAFKASIVGQ